MLHNGKPDRMIAGRQSGRVREVRDGPDQLCAGFDSGAGNGAPARCAACAGCDRIFEDRASGAKTDQRGLIEALANVREGDVLVIWKLDLLGRSLPHLIDTVSELEKRGVGLRSLTELIDTTTPGGRLVCNVFGALAQFERDLIRERTRAGLSAAASRGRRGGRKPVVAAEKLVRAKVLIAKGLTVREAASRLKIGKTALYDALIPKTGI